MIVVIVRILSLSPRERRGAGTRHCSRTMSTRLLTWPGRPGLKVIIEQEFAGVLNTTGSENPAPHNSRRHQLEWRRGQVGQPRHTSCRPTALLSHLRQHLRMLSTRGDLFLN